MAKANKGHRKVTVSIDPELSEKLEKHRSRVRRKDGPITRSKVVQQALRQYLRLHEDFG